MMENVKGGFQRNSLECYRGDIWFADLGMRLGSEQSGERPVILISNGAELKFSSVVKAIPVTSKLKRMIPVHVNLDDDCLSRESVALTEQLTTIDKLRLKSYIGKVNEETMLKLEKAILIEFAIDINKLAQDELHKLLMKNNIIDIQYIKNGIEVIRELDEILLNEHDLNNNKNSRILRSRALAINNLKYYCKKNTIDLVRFYDYSMMDYKILNNNKIYAKTI